jgi:hypothetical protein
VPLFVEPGHSGLLVDRPLVLNTRSVPLPVVQPMLATSGQPGCDQALWSWETKWDAWRVLVYIDGGLLVRARTGHQVSDSLPELTGLRRRPWIVSLWLVLRSGLAGSFPCSLFRAQKSGSWCRVGLGTRGS